MIHKDRSEHRAEIRDGDRRLLRRYESAVAAYAAELGHAERRGQRGKMGRLQARLAVFEHECAAIAEYLAESNGGGGLTDEKP